MLTILAISGSLRRKSLNRRALIMARDWAPPDCEIRLWEGLGALPLFSPDLDVVGHPVPAAVEQMRREIGAAHGLLIACPEYAHGLPGAFKNALDWLVGDTAFPGKPVACLNVAPRAIHAQAQLREILMTMSARLIEAVCCAAAFPRPEQPDSFAAFETSVRAALDAYAGLLRGAPH